MKWWPYGLTEPGASSDVAGIGMADQRMPDAKEASICKAMAGQAAIGACIEAIEICGAEGSIGRDHQLLERWFRDIKV